MALCADILIKLSGFLSFRHLRIPIFYFILNFAYRSNRGMYDNECVMPPFTNKNLLFLFYQLVLVLPEKPRSKKKIAVFPNIRLFRPVLLYKKNHRFVQLSLLHFNYWDSKYVIGIYV